MIEFFKKLFPQKTVQAVVATFTAPKPYTEQKRINKKDFRARYNAAKLKGDLAAMAEIKRERATQHFTNHG